MKLSAIIFLILVFGCTAKAQVDTSFRPINEREIELYQLLMQYRAENKLDSIPISLQLCKVAQVHVRDLHANSPTEKCNMHSWSSNGPWKAVCYTPDHRNAKGMWSKPSELTSYQDVGYEIAYWSSINLFNVEEALASWKESADHNHVILNLGVWKTHPWKAIGLAVENGYAVVWFGETE